MAQLFWEDYMGAFANGDLGLITEKQRPAPTEGHFFTK